MMLVSSPVRERLISFHLPQNPRSTSSDGQWLKHFAMCSIVVCSVFIFLLFFVHTARSNDDSSSPKSLFSPTQSQKLDGPFNVAVLMVKRYRKDAVRFDLVHIGPAIDMATEKCLNDLRIKFTVLEGYYEDTCNETDAIGIAHDLVHQNTGKIVAFIGPACSNDLQTVGKLAAYKKIPILTGLGDVIPAHRSDLTSLIRLSYDMKDKARAILAFLGYFHWKTFGLIYRLGDVYYDTLAKELLDLLKNPNYSEFKCSCREAYIRNYDKVIITDMSAVMRRIASCSRIVIVLGGDKDVRKILLLAHEQQMTRGDYAFIYPELIESEALGNMSWARDVDDPEERIKLKAAYQALLIVSLNQPPGDYYKNFSDEIKNRALKDYNYVYNEKVANYFTASFYDAILLLCRAIRETINLSLDPYDGDSLVKRMKNISLQGVSGEITIDVEGDRKADYALLDQTDIDSGSFEVVLRYYGARQNFRDAKEVKWPPGKSGIRPRDVPVCGFDGSECAKSSHYWNIVLATLLAIIALMLTISVVIYRKVKLETALTNMAWKVKWDEILLESSARRSFVNEIGTAEQKRNSLQPDVDPEETILCAHYKGNRVAIKKLPPHKIELNRGILMELKIMRETSHENLVRFVGACVDIPNAILTEYCPKGSLRDLLMNSSLHLDWIFRFSLINDIIAGLCYLHSSEHIFHGRLRSTNCLVDSRFCIKVSDFGLEKLREAASSGDFRGNKSAGLLNELRVTGGLGHDRPSNSYVDQYSPLYRSPDMLNDVGTRCQCKKYAHYKVNINKCYDCCYRGQKADVYSYAIILQEIINRSLPFHPYIICMDVPTITESVVKHDLRPEVKPELCDRELYQHMIRCWSRDPTARPDFNNIKRDMKNILKSAGIAEDNQESITLTEKLLTRMEQYANELESIVQQRTGELAEEKKKTEELLYQILPRVVADQLKGGESVVPDFYECVTVYFSDIVGFTEMCSQSAPIDVVNFLNDLYTCFDTIISDFDVYKVETIGDAYMVVSGLPERNGDEHVRQIAMMSIRVLDSVNGFVIRHRKEEKLKLRIGIHSGPCCTGVVGNKRPRYCLFGDTINTASRMESSGEALKIHVSSTTKQLLDKFKQFSVQERGDIIIKGKGIMKTYWLTGETDDSLNANVPHIILPSNEI